MKKDKPLSEMVEELHQVNQQSSRTTKPPKQEELTGLDAYISYCGGHEYNCKAVVYIDRDIHQVLSGLKTAKNIGIGKLLSTLAKDFVVEHRDAIKSCINANGYLK